MSDESLAEKINTETPWWATAPLWLAAGIVGVPSLIAIGAGYFVAKNVTDTLANNGKNAAYAISTVDSIKDRMKTYHDQDLQQFRLVHDFLAQIVRIEFRSCVREAKTPQERDDCLKTAKGDIERLHMAP